jgi:four helix bundle protein
MNKVEDLIIWKKAMELAKLVYQISVELPNDEKFGLNSQIKRCSVSIPSNISEGAGRNSNKEFKYFLSVANGSAYELQTQLLLIGDLKLIEKEKLEPLIELCVEIQKMNYSFQKKL